MLSEDEYEASMLVIIHTKITADWLLAKIAIQLGVEEPAEEKVRLLSQVFEKIGGDSGRGEIGGYSRRRGSNAQGSGNHGGISWSPEP